MTVNVHKTDSRVGFTVSVHLGHLLGPIPSTLAIIPLPEAVV